MITLVGLEMAALLLFVCLLLLWHLRGLRRLVAALEGKVIALRDSLRGERAKTVAARQAAEQARAPQRSYAEYIEEQIALTRNHHLSLQPDRDIVLDIAADVSLERQAMALRNAFLIAEQEAAQAAVDHGDVDWAVLEEKLGRIIEFYQQRGEEGAPIVGDDPEAENRRRHLENLERFKTLYFDMEQRWQRTQGELAGYRQQLLALGRGLGAEAEFEHLLAQYGRVCEDFGNLLLDTGEARPAPPTPAALADAADRPSVGRQVIANQEEIQRLRNMAVDQHKLILRLKQQLLDAHSLEQKDAVIAELHKQLDRQQQFLQESDVCARQLESEVHRLFDENHALQQRLESGAVAAADPEELARAQSLLTELTDEGRDMLAVIAALESENRGLQEHAGEAADELRRQLANAQQRLLELQTQHIELEERYLELKTGSN